MAKEHLEPSPATIKELYANAYRCAFPKCQRPLYKVDAETGTRTLNSRVAHICARREGGPRWNSTQSEEENRSVNNLLLLCIEHSYEIDDSNRVVDFPVELLLQWKRQQLVEFDALGQGWSLSQQEADEVAKKSFTMPRIEVTNSSISLGGEGGNAPGAGGGGGGAFGFGVKGGDGGSGGNITLDGSPGAAPGAGGSGGGSMGEGAIGGDGGGGGEFVAASFRLDELPGGYPAKFHIRVGLAGRGNGNGDGEDGEDSVVSIMNSDGTLHELLRAKGGKGGQGGDTKAKSLLLNELTQRLRVSSIMLANYSEEHNGLVFITGGGWDSFTVQSLPAVASGHLMFTLETGKIEIEGAYDVQIALNDPDQVIVAQIPLAIDFRSTNTINRYNRITRFQIEISKLGIWMFQIKLDDNEIARIEFEVRM